MDKKQGGTTDAVKILHRLLVAGDPEMEALLEQERLNLNVAQQIYDLRTQANLTQRQLAELVKTTPSVISRLEDADYNGHSVPMLIRIGLALHQKIELRFVPGASQESSSSEPQEEGASRSRGRRPVRANQGARADEGRGISGRGRSRARTDEPTGRPLAEVENGCPSESKVNTRRRYADERWTIGLQHLPARATGSAYDRLTSLKYHPTTSTNLREDASPVSTASGTAGSLLALSSAMLRDATLTGQ